MTEGIVLELNDGRAIIMTHVGEFLEIPSNRSWRIGDHVQFRRKPAFPWNTALKYTSAVAALFLLITIGLPWINFGAQQAVAAYISVDMNPSIELAVDKDERVISAVALDEDGTRLLSKLNIKGKPLGEATAMAMEQARVMGFLSLDSEEVLITVVVVDGSQQEEEEISRELEQVTKSKKRPSTNAATLIIGSTKLREEAKKLDLTSGQLILLLVAQQKGINVDVESLQNKSLKELVADHKDLRKVLNEGIQKEILGQLVAGLSVAKFKPSDKKGNKKIEQDMQDEKESNNKRKADKEPPGKEKSKKPKQVKQNKGQGKDVQVDHKNTLPTELPSFKLKLPSLNDIIGDEASDSSQEESKGSGKRKGKGKGKGKNKEIDKRTNKGINKEIDKDKDKNGNKKESKKENEDNEDSEVKEIELNINIDTPIETTH